MLSLTHNFLLRHSKKLIFVYSPVYFLRKWPLDKDVHHRIVPYFRCILDAAMCAFFVALHVGYSPTQEKENQ